MPSALARASTGLNRSMDSATVQLMLAREKPSEAAANTETTFAPAARAASKPFSFGTSTWNSAPLMWLTPRKTASELAICGIALGETKAPTSTVSRPAPTSASMKAVRASTLTSVFSFWRPSRGPISMMRTLSLISFSGRLDHGELDALLDDVADLAFDGFQHAGIGRTQRLLHLHHFQGEDRRALLELGALLRQHGDDGARQGRCDLVHAGLLLHLAAERIDPMQVEPAVARTQIQLMAVDHGRDRRFDAIESKIEAAVPRRNR